jgi:hypothetical protein
MATRTAGLTTATKILIGQPQRQRDSSGNWTVTYRYAVAIANGYSQSPTHGAAIPAPEATDHPNLICTDVQLDDAGDGTNMFMVVIYSEPSGTILVSGGSAIRSTRSAVIEKMVDEVAADDTDAADLKALGKRSKAEFTVSYHRRSVEAAYTWSQANIIDGVGKRGAPTGLASATANLWVKTERNATEQNAGGGTELEEVWVYDEAGWDDRLYGT